MVFPVRYAPTVRRPHTTPLTALALHRQRPRLQLLLTAHRAAFGIKVSAKMTTTVSVLLHRTRGKYLRSVVK